MRWDSYLVMSSTEDTLAALAEAEGRARIIAGGTDLLVELKREQGHTQPLRLLDIRRVGALGRIEQQEESLVIGSAATMSSVTGSPMVASSAHALAQGAGFLGSPQIRNLATVGGNLVNAMPAADTAVPLVALGAQAHIASRQTERTLPVEELFLGLGKSAIDPSKELLTHLTISKCGGPRRASAMKRMAPRKAFTLPQLSIAVMIELDAALAAFENVRIVMAPMAPTPKRAKQAESFLIGQSPTTQAIEQAAALAREEANPRDSIRGGAAYRKDMVRVMTKRALHDALAQLGVEIHD